MLLIVEMTSKRVPICSPRSCDFAVETEDGRVYCKNSKCIYYLQNTTSRCGRPELPEKAMVKNGKE